MAQTTLDQIMDQISALGPNELRQINRAVQERLSSQAEAAQYAAFHEALLSAGLVTRIKPPRIATPPEHRLIEAQGVPVSQTILEERR